MVLRALMIAVAMVSAPALAEELSSSSEPMVAPVGPAALSDTDLELAVRAAYLGASSYASSHGNYFARDGVSAPVREAVLTDLSTAGFSALSVPDVSTAEPATLKTCLGSPGTALRIGTNAHGDGLTLVAVTDSRVFAYAYDPHKAADIVVTPAEACSKAQ